MRTGVLSIPVSPRLRSARADPRAPQRLRYVLDPAYRHAGQVHLDHRFLDRGLTALVAFDDRRLDTYSKVAHCKLYTTKTPITAADLLNDRVLPFFESHDLPLLRVLTDRGTEYCGRAERHDYQLFLAVNDIDHTKTRVKSPQTNGICERFHKTVLQEFYQVTFRKKIYESLETLQADLDVWVEQYNTERTHQGKMCCGRTLIETLEAGKAIWKEKLIA